MTAKLLSVSLLSTVLFFCKKSPKFEDPGVLARAYCDCIEKKLHQAESFSVDIHDCNAIFFGSRLFRIHFEKQKDERYAAETLDSSNAFFLEVGKIIDTLCLNKIHPGKLKRIPHVKM